VTSAEKIWNEENERLRTMEPENQSLRPQAEATAKKEAAAPPAAKTAAEPPSQSPAESNFKSTVETQEEVANQSPASPPLTPRAVPVAKLVPAFFNNLFASFHQTKQQTNADFHELQKKEEQEFIEKEKERKRKEDEETLARTSFIHQLSEKAKSDTAQRAIPPLPYKKHLVPSDDARRRAKRFENTSVPEKELSRQVSKLQQESIPVPEKELSRQVSKLQQESIPVQAEELSHQISQLQLKQITEQRDVRDVPSSRQTPLKKRLMPKEQPKEEIKKTVHVINEKYKLLLNERIKRFNDRLTTFVEHLSPIVATFKRFTDEILNPIYTIPYLDQYPYHPDNVDSIPNTLFYYIKQCVSIQDYVSAMTSLVTKLDILFQDDFDNKDNNKIYAIKNITGINEEITSMYEQLKDKISKIKDPHFSRGAEYILLIEKNLNNSVGQLDRTIEGFTISKIEKWNRKTLEKYILEPEHESVQESMRQLLKTVINNKEQGVYGIISFNPSATRSVERGDHVDDISQLSHESEKREPPPPRDTTRQTTQVGSVVVADSSTASFARPTVQKRQVAVAIRPPPPPPKDDRRSASTPRQNVQEAVLPVPRPANRSARNEPNRLQNANATSGQGTKINSIPAVHQVGSNAADPRLLQLSYAQQNPLSKAQQKIYHNRRSSSKTRNNVTSTRL